MQHEARLGLTHDPFSERITAAFIDKACEEKNASHACPEEKFRIPLREREMHRERMERLWVSDLFLLVELEGAVRPCKFTYRCSKVRPVPTVLVDREKARAHARNLL